MDKKEIEEHLQRLKELEKEINSDEDIDNNFMDELNKILNVLNEDIMNEVSNNTNTQTVNKNELLVKVKKLNPNAVIPSYSKFGDAGMDLTITSEIEDTPFNVTYGFGIAMEIPKGHVGLIFPRSSVRNQELILSNCVGVVDSGYRGELQATFKKTNGIDSLKYKVGERGAQIMILPYPQVYMTEVPELSNSERGTGGFGSTGK